MTRLTLLLLSSLLTMQAVVAQTPAPENQPHTTNTLSCSPGDKDCNIKDPDLNQTHPMSIYFPDDQVILKMGESTTLTFVVTLKCVNSQGTYSLRVSTENSNVAFFSGDQDTSYVLRCGQDNDGLGTSRCTGSGCGLSTDVTWNNEFISVDTESPPNDRKSNPRTSWTINVTLSTDLIGRTFIQVYSNMTYNPKSNGALFNQSYDAEGHRNNTLVTQSSFSNEHIVRLIPVAVLRNIRPVDIIFRVVLYTFVALASMGMGTKTDLEIVKKVLKRPLVPGLGLFAQYVCMPLIAYMVSQVIKFDNPAVRLGIFTCGVCPGGGASNIFTYLLRGDISLSVTMTCISSIAAIGMIPLWMFTLGQTFNDDKISIEVPYLKILETLAIVLVPLLIGFALNIKLPKVAAKFTKIIKPISVVTVIFILTVGIYSNLYIFRLMEGGVVAAACMLPYIGYLLGGLLALAACQPWPRVKTVAIETGIQNTSVAYLMLTFSLPAPDADLAAVGSASSALMTPLPLLVISIVYSIYNCRKDRKEGGDDDEEEVKKAMQEDENQDNDRSSRAKGRRRIGSQKDQEEDSHMMTSVNEV